MQLQGTVHKIYETAQVTETFKKRDFVLRIDEDVNGQTYTQHLKIQLTQAKCDLLNDCVVGQRITATINLKGKEYTKKDGTVDYFTTLEAWKLDKGAVTQANQVIQQEVAKGTDQVFGGSNVDNSIDQLPF